MPDVKFPRAAIAFCLIGAAAFGTSRAAGAQDGTLTTDEWIARVEREICKRDSAIFRHPEPITIKFTDFAKLAPSAKARIEPAIARLAAETGIQILLNRSPPGGLNSYVTIVGLPFGRDRLDDTVAPAIERALQSAYTSFGMQMPTQAYLISERLEEMYEKNSYTYHYSITKGGLPIYTVLVVRMRPDRPEAHVVASLVSSLAYNHNSDGLSAGGTRDLLDAGVGGAAFERQYRLLSRVYADKSIGKFSCDGR